MNVVILFHGARRRLRPFASGALALAIVLTLAAVAVSGFAINLGRLNSSLNSGPLASSGARFSEPLVETGAVPADAGLNDRP